MWRRMAQAAPLLSPLHGGFVLSGTGNGKRARTQLQEETGFLLIIINKTNKNNSVVGRTRQDKAGQGRTRQDKAGRTTANQHMTTNPHGTANTRRL